MLTSKRRLLTAIFCLTILPLFFAGAALSQTCSCAGAPLLGTQSAGASGAGNLLIGVTYEFNQITNLYTGSEQITNDSADRHTQSVLFELNYGPAFRIRHLLLCAQTENKRYWNSRRKSNIIHGRHWRWHSTA